MKFLVIVCILSIMLMGCEEGEIHTYLGENYVQFDLEKENRVLNYSFLNKKDGIGKPVTIDTVWLPAFCTGDMGNEVRFFRLKQVVEYISEPRFDETGALLDSVLVAAANQAEPGVHYIDFNDPGYLELCKVKPNVVEFLVPIILLRDLSLKKEKVTLALQFMASDDFKEGDFLVKMAQVVIGDMLEFPKAWSNIDYGEAMYMNPELGRYSEVKHQLLIDLTGDLWDDEFLKSLTYDQRVYYRHIARQELDRINAKRAEEGEGPLLEDPDNPNSIVVF